MPLVISVPSKSFFVGEYSALNGGPAITVSTAPRFELKVKTGAGWLSGINKDSPAEKLIKKNPLFFNQFDLEFMDPHRGRGGWGASAAQFLACYALMHWQETQAAHPENQILDTLEIPHMLTTYKEVAWDGQGIQPSGADLVGQLKGGFTFYDKRKGIINSLNWSFKDLEFYLIPTGQKVATHEHLQQLKTFNTDQLESYVQKVQIAFSSNNPLDFVEGIHHISKELENRQWVFEKTKDYLQTLNAIPGVLASKGCGALGADVVLAIVEKSKSVLFEALLKDDNRAYFSRHHMTKGLDISGYFELRTEPFNSGILP